MNNFITLKSWVNNRLELYKNDLEKVQFIYSFYFWAKGKYGSDLTIKTHADWLEEFKIFIRGEYEKVQN